MINGWNKIIFYRRIYWILFFLLVPIVLVVQAIARNEFIVAFVFVTYSGLVGIYLKVFLFSQICPNCKKKFFPAWGDLLFTRCSSCGCKIGSLRNE